MNKIYKVENTNYCINKGDKLLGCTPMAWSYINFRVGFIKNTWSNSFSNMGRNVTIYRGGAFLQFLCG
jgi:hypothetical protein